MQPIIRQRVDDCVYDQLLYNIKSGVWKGGEKLPSESELCDILKVSRVSVRSALQRLQALRLIEIKRAKGSFVCNTEELFDFSTLADPINLSRKEFIEIAQLREVIEGGAVEILAARSGPADFSRLSAAYRGMKQAVRELDAAAFTRHDLNFHLSIVLATGNDKLTRIAQIFREDFFHFLHESNKFLLRDQDDREKFKSHFEKSLVYHTELRDALIHRNPQAPVIQTLHLRRQLERLDSYYTAAVLQL